MADLVLLGGYTSLIRKGNETKNIVFPFDQYAEQWVIGFVYDRVATKKSADSRIFDVFELEHIRLPFANVEFFVQEKWRISSDRAGSGNTTNISSITATLEEFQAEGIFKSEEEFLARKMHRLGRISYKVLIFYGIKFATQISAVFAEQKVKDSDRLELDWLLKCKLEELIASVRPMSARNCSKSSGPFSIALADQVSSSY